MRFYTAFQDETPTPSTDVLPLVRERMDDRRLWLWEDGAGAPVSLAARTPAVAGVARIAPVYTPPEHRRRGYATAVTAACTADALARDAERVVLYTDLADPSANAMYQRIGFRPIGGRRVVRSPDAVDVAQLEPRPEAARALDLGPERAHAPRELRVGGDDPHALAAARLQQLDDRVVGGVAPAARRDQHLDVLGRRRLAGVEHDGHLVAAAHGEVVRAPPPAAAPRPRGRATSRPAASR